MLVDAFISYRLSLLNQFLCDRAIIDKTLFYERYSMIAPPAAREPGERIS
jgi:hypothetical protein